MIKSDKIENENNNNQYNKNIYVKKKYSSMITRLTSEGYHIKISSISTTLLDNIINDLTAIPYKLDATQEEIEKSKFPLYRYSDDRLELIVPRYYGISKYGSPLITEFNSIDIDIKFTNKLRDIQESVSEKCISYMKRNGGGLLSVPCGFGKTVCALYIAYRLGLKTLVIVHKSFLIKQWIERAKEFLNISDRRIGTIRRDQCEVFGKDLVFGMIQTISKRDYDKSIFEGFGLVIYDEAHHVACKFFSKTLLKTGAQYTLALTATPYRGDGLIKVMYWFAGGTIYREQLKMNKNVIVKVINYSSNDKLFKPKQKWFQGKFRADTGKMITNICQINSRNNKIIEIITHIRRTEPARKILILSGRKDHLTILKMGVDAAIQDDIDAGLINKEDIYSCYYMGNTKPLDRYEAEIRGDIIFATYDMANEGLDIKHLNTVLLVSGKRDVVQSVGRIMRTVLKCGDVRPMIIDFADNINVICGWLKVRTTIYTKCKYEIENYYLKNDKFCTYHEYNGTPLTKDNIHHENVYIHNMINTNNTIMNDWKENIKAFKGICKKIETKLNLDHDEFKSPIEDNEYKILDNLEFTDLSDIFYVPKLTAKDFDLQIIKDYNENDEIDLEKDMRFDEEDIKHERTIIQALHNNVTKTAIPQKRLF